MNFFVFFGVLSIAYAMLMFFDYFFKSCMMLPYIEFLKKSGISVRFFRIQFYTTNLNRTIVKWSSKMPSIYRNSFKLGSYVTMILFPVAICLVVASLFSGSSSPTSQNESTVEVTKEVARLEILLPGINLPLNQIGYYVLALLICSVVHEAGHAIAAGELDKTFLTFNMFVKFLIFYSISLSAGRCASYRLWYAADVHNPGSFHRDRHGSFPIGKTVEKVEDLFCWSVEQYPTCVF